MMLDSCFFSYSIAASQGNSWLPLCELSSHSQRGALRIRLAREDPSQSPGAQRGFRTTDL